MDFFWTMIAYAAAVGIWFRFAQYFKKNLKCDSSNIDLPLVSVIVPVRNEAQAIKNVLGSLLLLDYPKIEVIVVDDCSEDDTFNIACKYAVKTIKAPTKPHDWIGKNWACYTGAQQASGSYLLFTDADTVHAKTSLLKAMIFLLQTKSHMVSASPYHRNELWWEKLLGPFYCVMQAGASPYDQVSADHPYAVGQYLLFEKKIYEQIGGHAAVRSALAEDASLARRVMASGGRYSIYNGPALVKVQMYKSLGEFWKGWSRILRLGMKELKSKVILNTMLPLLALNITNIMAFTFVNLVPVITTLICFAFIQRKTGDFSLIGIFLFPLPVLFFVILSCWSLFSHLLNFPVTWRGRRYFLNRDSWTSG